jgi:hypothetical protein
MTVHLDEMIVAYEARRPAALAAVDEALAEHQARLAEGEPDAA